MSAICLIILLPAFAVIALIIKLDSKGPVLFRQKRVGWHEKEFYIYKFRTMRTDTPSLPPNKFHDVSKYITKSGRILRKTSLDELPQLLNVLVGEMSFVGPRPGAAKNEEELILERRKRNVFSVRPGVTGWAQVNGRDELAHDVIEKSKHDEFYINNLTFKMDLICVLRTLHVVGSGKGYQEGANGEKTA